MERGQSTIEVAIAFPVLIIMLWWALVPPLVGVRALAARTAVLAGARRGVVDDGAIPAGVAQDVRQTWTGLAGAGQERQVGVEVRPTSLRIRAEERAMGLPVKQALTLEVRRERD